MFAFMFITIWLQYFCDHKAQYQKTAANAFFFLHKTHRTIRCNKSDKILICFLHVLNLKETINVCSVCTALEV